MCHHNPQVLAQICFQTNKIIKQNKNVHESGYKETKKNAARNKAEV